MASSYHVIRCSSIAASPRGGPGRLDEAIALYRQVIAKRADTEDAYRKLALDPNLPGAHTALGVALAETNREAEAIDSWKRAIEIEPRELNALYNLTIYLTRMGRRDEARAYGERFIALAPPMLQADAERVRRLISRN